MQLGSALIGGPGLSGVLARRYPTERGVALFQELRPRDDLGVFFEQSPALTFSQAAPDAVFDLVVEGVSGALLHDRAVPADHRGFALCGPPHEEFVRIRAPTQRF